MSSSSSSITLTPESLYEQLYEEALAICQLYSRLDSSIHYTATKIFAAPTDRRVKRGGHLFIAHLLRFAVLVQLSLFPGTDICDYARITIPNILQFCKNRSQNGWPWCYDTTLKYFNLLVAAGVLIVRKREPGIYYLPLGPCVLLPDHARRQIAELATQRTKVSRSSAFRRAADHCLVSTLPARGETHIGIDDQDARQAALAINAVLQRQQGVTLLPTTLAEVVRILAVYAPRLLQKGTGTFPALSAPSTLQSSIDSDADQVQQTFPDQTGQKHMIADQQSLQEQQNLPVPGRAQLGGEQESTILNESQLYNDNIADSGGSCLTESVISLKKVLLLSERSEFTINGQRRKRRVAESTDLAHSVDLAATDASNRVSDLSEDEIRYWAAWLSNYINHNGSKIGHYTTYLRQSPEILHIALVDALVRSVFPDPHRKPDRLGGGWVTNRYKTYCAGTEEVPPEVFAWSQTGLPYQELKALLEAEARYQDTWGQAHKRPFPDEVQEVLASADVQDFWQEGAACGLEEGGYRYVDVDGELLTCRQYQRLRRRALAAVLESVPDTGHPETQRAVDSRELPPEVEHEVEGYLEWYQARLYSPEEIEALLEGMSEATRQEILAQIHQLEAALDPAQYDVEVVLLPIRRGTPIERGLLIEVRNRNRPAKECWLIHSGAETEQLIWSLAQQGSNTLPAEEMQGTG